MADILQNTDNNAFDALLDRAGLGDGGAVVIMGAPEMGQTFADVAAPKTHRGVGLNLGL